ncbi:MAG: DNA polymerase III subunit delta' [Candidatus Omnitrophica bacterium]|nr:DNA polymerase III subunit delta' [Candidatus Omnitrophota bacterium]
MINPTQINDSVMQRFSRLMANHRLAHAYLLVGPKDSGKTQTALSLAQMVNCESESPKPCGECTACRKIISGNHPDVHVIGNDETESIKIEDIRFLLSRAHLMAYEAKTKVFIIRDIELMTLEAANALLKTLEEPEANTLMILTTSVPEIVLDTIKSRCHTVKFFSSSVNRITQLLIDEGVKDQDAHFLAFYSEGCMGKTRKLIKQEIISRRHKVLDEMLLNRNNDSFLKDLSADPQEAVQALRLLLSFFRDVLLLKCGVSITELAHQDCLKEMEKFAARGFEDLSLIIRQIVQAKELVDENLNVRMSLSLLREHIWGN